MLKSSKHRCSCYSQQYGSFLYGIRRDTPSTERVLLERLLNVLSRAASHRNKNPQRLWAESERPEWWTEVTDLPWKNPREHPKDNKLLLKKKIEILERQLQKRGMMTKELEEELKIHRDSKKTDLELKSDFEAIISKASGLHFMLDKVSSKMGQSRIFSDKMATYIKETSSCIGKIHKIINTLHKQVEVREERKSDLWASMGVSKHQQTTQDDDQIMTDFGFDLEMMDDLPDDLVEMFSPNTVCRLPTPGPTLSPDSYLTKPFSPLSPLSPPTMSSESPKSSSTATSLGITTPQAAKPKQDSLTTFQRSLSQPKSVETEAQAAHTFDVSQISSASVAPPVFTKRTWNESVDKEEDLDRVAARVKSPRTLEGASYRDVILIDDRDDLPINTLSTSVSERESAKDRRSASETETTHHGQFSKIRRPRSYGESVLRSKHKPYSLSAPSKQQYSTSATGGFRSLPTTGYKPSATVVSHYHTTDPLIGASNVKVTSTSKGKAALAVEDDLPWDVVEDVGDCFLEDISEKREMPTYSMYPKDTSGMHYLLEKTKSLSVEDLQPSVTEPFISDFPSPKVGQFVNVGKTTSGPYSTTQLRKHSQKSSTVTANPTKRQTSVVRETDVEEGFLTLGTESDEEASVVVYRRPQLSGKSRHVPTTDGDGGRSLSRAIGDLGTNF